MPLANDMIERPILFSTPMVLALLDGTKTQTRRVVKPQPPATVLNPTMVSRDSAAPSGYSFVSDEYGDILLTCPYGQPGERLWVREKFQPIFADGYTYDTADWKTGRGYAPRYPATDDVVEWVDADDIVTSRCNPSIHMPRWASRILLEIVSVRVERLHDISEKDAIAEGIEPHEIDGWKRGKLHGDQNILTVTAFPKLAFRSIWEAINGHESWDANPWVWVVEFSRLRP